MATEEMRPLGTSQQRRAVRRNEMQVAVLIIRGLIADAESLNEIKDIRSELRELSAAATEVLGALRAVGEQPDAS